MLTQRVLRVVFKRINPRLQLLGVERLAWYDLQAPLRATGDSGGDRLSYQRACELIVEAFHEFSAELGEFGELALKQSWIEAENRSGKRQGGFCTGFPTKGESRIFTTFTETRDSMSTLAHELGHAYHSYVLRDQPIYLQQYPMNLAETASTFAEAVLADVMLREAKSPAEEAALLDGMLADAVTFLMNIYCRFLFEDEFYRQRVKGEIPTEQLHELMTAAQQRAYCDQLSADGWYPQFWVSKLHFYISELPFYNFPYTFGYLLSLGVYSLAGSSQGSFPDEYRNLLVATGRERTEDAVRNAFGCDLTEPDFWERSLDVIAGRIERFLAATEGAVS